MPSTTAYTHTLTATSLPSSGRKSFFLIATKVFLTAYTCSGTANFLVAVSGAVLSMDRICGRSMCSFSCFAGILTFIADEILQLIFYELTDPSPLTFVSRRFRHFSQDPYVRAHYFLIHYGPVEAMYHALGRGKVLTDRVLDVRLCRLIFYPVLTYHRQSRSY
jgi:hypothetical protein